MKRGQIWWAELAEPQASEPGYKRPVIIVQSDAFNRSGIKTVIVVTVTSNLRLAEAPGNVKLLAAQTGLGRDSVANVSQVVTLDKSFLRDMAGQLDQVTMRLIDDGLAVVLGL